MFERFIHILIVSIVSFFVTMSGVIFFFKPIATSDTSVLSLPPIVGLIYIFMCVGIYFWAHKETASYYKSALVVILPQAAFIIDLMLRGDRGLMTTAAGLLLLFITWFITAFFHKLYSERKT